MLPWVRAGGRGREERVLVDEGEEEGRAFLVRREVVDREEEEGLRLLSSVGVEEEGKEEDEAKSSSMPLKGSSSSF